MLTPDFWKQLLTLGGANAAQDPLRPSTPRRRVTAPGPMPLSSLLPRTPPAPPPTVITPQPDVVAKPTSNTKPAPTTAQLLYG